MAYLLTIQTLKHSLLNSIQSRHEKSLFLPHIKVMVLRISRYHHQELQNSRQKHNKMIPIFTIFLQARLSHKNLHIMTHDDQCIVDDSPIREV